MIKRRLRIGFVAALAAIVLGCGGRSHHFTAAAVPIAINMRDALKRSNTSDLAGSVERARELRTAGAITDADLKQIVFIYDLAWGNSWDDARKLLEESLAGG